MLYMTNLIHVIIERPIRWTTVGWCSLKLVCVETRPKTGCSVWGEMGFSGRTRLHLFNTLLIIIILIFGIL